MRKKNREIKEFNDLVDILQRADTIRLGINGSPHPYVVPLSYGFEAVDGKITIYFHGAAQGLKHDLIRENPYVCVETDIFGGYIRDGGSATTLYESFIGFGEAEVITGGDAERAMEQILLHCGFCGLEYNKGALRVTKIYKVELTSFTGKRRIKDN